MKLYKGLLETSSVSEVLATMYKTLGFNPSMNKQGVITYSSNTQTKKSWRRKWKFKAIPCMFKFSLGYKESLSQKKKKSPNETNKQKNFQCVQVLVFLVPKSCYLF